MVQSVNQNNGLFIDKMYVRAERFSETIHCPLIGFPLLTLLTATLQNFHFDSIYEQNCLNQLLMATC